MLQSGVRTPASWEEGKILATWAWRSCSSVLVHLSVNLWDTTGFMGFLVLAFLFRTVTQGWGPGVDDPPSVSQGQRERIEEDTQKGDFTPRSSAGRSQGLAKDRRCTRSVVDWSPCMWLMDGVSHPIISQHTYSFPLPPSPSTVFPFCFPSHQSLFCAGLSHNDSVLPIQPTP